MRSHDHPIDVLHRFVIRNAPVRGYWVRLGDVWHDACRNFNPEPPLKRALGEMLVVVAMLANTIKLDGKVSLQARGDGRVSLALAECAGRVRLRGFGRLRSDAPMPLDPNFKTLLGNGELAINLLPDSGQPYQGIVPLEAGRLEHNVEQYFLSSEQLPTRIRLASDADQTFGCLLQLLPDQAKGNEMSEAARERAWAAATRRLDRIPNDAFLGLPPAALLRQGFPRDELELDTGTALRFACTCSRQRSLGALSTFASAELNDILVADGNIHVDCEFCGARYVFERTDLTDLI